MAIKTAYKYLLSFPADKSIKQRVWRVLAHNKNIELLKKKTEEKSNNQENKLDYWINSVFFAIEFLTPYEQKKSWKEKLSPGKINIKREKIEKFSFNKELHNLVNRVSKIEKEQNKINQQKKDLTNQLKQVQPLTSLGFVPEDTLNTKTVLLKLPQNVFVQLVGANKQKSVAFQVIKQDKAEVIAIMSFIKNLKQNLIGQIENLGGKLINYSFQNVPSEVVSNLEKSISKLNKQSKRLTTELLKLAQKIGQLKVYHDLLLIEKNKHYTAGQAKKSRFLDYIVFYALPQNKQILLKKLKKISPAITCLRLEEKKENLPVVLNNNQVFSPFQYVTEIFGLPKASEIDPTPFLAFFFVLFFGICLTDAGYGLLLCLLTGLALLFFGKLFSDKKLIKLLFIGGIFTLISGILFGSYFGVDIGQINFLPFLKGAKKIDPIKDTIIFMGLSFALGYVQIVFSQIVRLISGLKNKDKDFIVLGLSWCLFYLSGIIMIGSLKFAQLKTIGLISLIFCGLLVAYAESRLVKNLFLKPVVALVNILQGLINTMSDILSYSRLMALGLATGVIALIVNQIAWLFKDIIPVLGWVVAILILIGGHLFNLGINALGAFIHSGRLQFVEFFPKFLQGGGRRFVPNSVELNFIKVV